MTALDAPGLWQIIGVRRLRDFDRFTWRSLAGHGHRTPLATPRPQSHEAADEDERAWRDAEYVYPDFATDAARGEDANSQEAADDSFQDGLW